MAISREEVIIAFSKVIIPLFTGCKLMCQEAEPVLVEGLAIAP
jgi:hypothetical protein